MGRQMLADPETRKGGGEPRGRHPPVHQLLHVRGPTVLRPAGAMRREPGARPRGRGSVRWNGRRRPPPAAVVIVGGGPAGMEAARVAALRGHRVTLFEASAQLGGSLRFAALVYEPKPSASCSGWQMEELGVDVRPVDPGDGRSRASARARCGDRRHRCGPDPLDDPWRRSSARRRRR
ncbi:MAG: FAD-dependent oxidoreductase [Acidimicrobiales bacterium]